MRHRFILIVAACAVGLAGIGAAALMAQTARIGTGTISGRVVDRADDRTCR